MNIYIDECTNEWVEWWGDFGTRSRVEWRERLVWRYEVL